MDKKSVTNFYCRMAFVSLPVQKHCHKCNEENLVEKNDEEHYDENDEEHYDENDEENVENL